MERNHSKSHIWTIMKKELKRFFGDRRMLATVLLPGILIYVIYSLMGDGMMAGLLGGDDRPYIVQAENLPASVEVMLEGAEVPVEYVQTGDPEAALKEGEIDLYAVFPAEFDALVAGYDPAGGEPAPEVRLFYNSTETMSQMAYSLYAEMLNAYESTLANRLDINRDPAVTYDLAAPEDITGMLFSMLMPMLLVMLMFSSCMAMTTEAIAGEKERGTIATLLVTPIKRSELAIGKIAALSIMSLLGGVCSFAGVLLSLPKLMGGEDMGMLDASVYGVSDYAMILMVILSTILVFVSAIAVLSALANSVKEAGTMITPLMMVVTIVGVSGMFSAEHTPLGLFLIPVYNSVQCISGVFSMNYQPVQILLTVVVNVLATGALALVLTRMFRSERIMFKK